MFKDKAKEIFGAYSKEEVVHFTSDGQAFFQKHLAESNAQSLKDRDITTITRDAAFAEHTAVEETTVAEAPAVEPVIDPLIDPASIVEIPVEAVDKATVKK